MVNWKTTSVPDEFVVYFRRSALSVRTMWDIEEQKNSIVFLIRNETGKEVDRFTVSDQEDQYSDAQQLHDLARHRAMGVDSAIDEMLGELASDDSVGEDRDQLDDDLPF